MDILLVEVRGSNKFINNGLAYLGGAIKGRHSFKIVDLNHLDWTDDKLCDYIIETNPKIIGFSVKSSNVQIVSQLIVQLKGKISGKIIVGGPHISLRGEEFLRDNPDVSYGLQFEAEASFPAFLDYLDGNKEAADIPGLVYRINENCLMNKFEFDNDLDGMAFPDYDSFEGIDAKKYFEDHSYPLLTSRGCPYNCIYCSVKTVSGRIWRSRSVDNILQEIMLAREKYGIKKFDIVDDNFTMDIDRAQQFCATLIENKCDFKWSCPNGIRADKVTPELAESMKLAGCEQVSLGIESGVPEIFARIKKGESLEDVTAAAQALMKNGIRVTGFFIVGLPGDSLELTKKTVKYIKELKLNGGVKWNFLIPYPETELWDWVRSEATVLNDFSQGRHFSKSGAKIIPIFETADFSAADRLKAWKIANLSVGAYSNVLDLPEKKLPRQFKIFINLLYYAPGVFWKKIFLRLRPVAEAVEKVKAFYEANMAVRVISNFAYLLAVFALAVAVWYSPILLKGGPNEPTNADQLVLARNYAQTGIIGSESNLNVSLAPELVKQSAQPSSSGNKFTVYSYAEIFRLFGWQSWNNLVLISVIICAISLIFFTLAAYFAFGLPIALIFPFIFIFLPFNFQTAQSVGSYEFTLLYFSVFCALYFFGCRRKWASAYLAISGVFLSLACLSKEAFFIFLPVLFFWQLLQKKIKDLLAVFIPVGVVLVIFWLPAMLGFSGANDYSKLFVEKRSTGQEYSDFWYYNHIYPDPYSYHFNHQQTLEKLNTDLASPNVDWTYKVDRLKIGKNMGLRSLNFGEWLTVGTMNLIQQLSKYFTIDYMGGPFIFLLMILGFIELKKKDRNIYRLFAFWLISAPLLISYAVLGSRNHLMDYGFAIAALVSFGLIGLSESISNHYFSGKYFKFFCIFLVALTTYGLVVADHVYFGRGYDDKTNAQLQYLASKIMDATVPADAVIAVGIRNGHPMLNYLTGKSVVYFNADTVRGLANENKLQDAFDKFGVKYIAGYDKELSDLIVGSSKVENLADQIDPKDLEIPLSDTKGWLLNLIK